MEIDGAMKRGSAEVAILSVLSRESLHGYEIARRIEETSGGALKFDLASLYPLLYRMERDAWLKAEWSEVGGRRRRCYTLTDKGRKQLGPMRAQWREFFAALNRVAGIDHA